MRKSVFVLIFSLLLLLVAGVMFSRNIYPTLPDISVLDQLPLTEGTLPICDRSGNFLFEYSGTPVAKVNIPLEEISPYLVAATVAVEDRSFFTNRGYSVWAIIRAFLQNVFNHGVVSGASTITQQLVRNVLMPPEERYGQSLSRKIREAWLAVEVTCRFSKERILEIYMNEIYYGGTAYGVEAAAQQYCGVSARDADFQQAALIAGMPQAPSYYSLDENRDAMLARRDDVLRIMQRVSDKDNCIYIGYDRPRVCVSP